MFRAQQNAFDDAVAKATDENLTSENWEYILDVCDRANGEDSGPKDVVSAMIGMRTCSYTHSSWPTRCRRTVASKSIAS